MYGYNLKKINKAMTINIVVIDLSTNFLGYGLIVGLYFLWASCLGDRLVKINGPPYS